MKYLTTILLGTLLFFTTAALAGSNHSHSLEPVSSKEAAGKALGIVTRLTDEKKIDSTWIKAKVDTVEQKTYSGAPEWVVTFKNDKVKDTAKQTLYIFFTLGGEYLGANHSGN